MSISCNGIAPGEVETNIGASMTNVSEFGFGRKRTGQGTVLRVDKPDEELSSLF